MATFVLIAVSSLLAAGVALLVIRQHGSTTQREVVRPIEDPKRLTRKKSRR